MKKKPAINDKELQIPKLIFYDVNEQKDIDIIDGGLIFLELDRKTLDVIYLSHKEWLSE